MPSDTYTLTRDKTSLASIIDTHLEREESRLTYRWVMWKLCYHYLSGARRFDVFDPHTGAIQAHFLDEEGRMEYQSQELLSLIDRVSGQISAMDIRPMVHRAGNSLSSIKDRAITQVMADAVVSDEAINESHTKFSHLFTALGSCGVSGHLEDHPVVGLTADFEIVHPREVFPWPSLGQDYTKQRGIVRRRTVPLEWLKQKVGKRRINANLEDMYWWKATAGSVPHHDTAYDDRGGADSSIEYVSSGYQPPRGQDSDVDTEIGMVRIEELWLTGHRGLVTRYVLKSGTYIIDDQDYTDLEVYCPLGWARFIENGTFHGMGMFDLLFPLHRQLELLLKSLFNNIRDIDRYGVIVMPSGQYNERALLRDVGNGLRVLPWEPDPVDSGFKPFSITPHNAGDVPGKTAAFAQQMMHGISPWQNLIQEKGRVDSMVGLGFLDEKIRQLMTNATRAVDQCWSTVHRSVLSSVARDVAATRRALPVNKLSIDLAGVVIDKESDMARFDQNPLPRLSHMTVTIKEANPKSEIVRKQEALELFKMEGLNDPMGFKLFALKEGLDFAMWMEDEKSAYESIVRAILTLYGNGEQAGQLVLTPDTVLPNVQLRVLSSFMGSPTMAAASPEVINEFQRLKQFLLESSGYALPEAVPNPDDLAMLMMEPEKMARMGPPAEMAQGQGGAPLRLAE